MSRSIGGSWGSRASMKWIDYREVLKDIAVERVSSEARELAKRFGYLPYMVERYLSMLGHEETLELLNAFENLRPPPAIRVNTLRIGVDELVQRLEALGFELRPVKWCSYCLEVVKFPESPSIGSTHEYLKGLYYVYRDSAPTIPPSLAPAKPGHRVLDVCAAPGGKATHLLQQMEDVGLLIANDKARSRIPVLIAHIQRMGFRSAVVTCLDGRDLPKILKPVFDYVLVDAPCSAEGGIMYDPGRKTRTSIEDLAKLVAREIELLESGAKLLRRGGVLVYSTCSIAPEENEYVVTRVLKRFPDLDVVEPPTNLWSWGLDGFRGLEFDKRVRRCVRVWPHRHGVEGFFVCILVKR